MSENNTNDQKKKINISFEDALLINYFLCDEVMLFLKLGDNSDWAKEMTALQLRIHDAIFDSKTSKASPED